MEKDQLVPEELRLCHRGSLLRFPMIRMKRFAYCFHESSESKIDPCGIPQTMPLRHFILFSLYLHPPTYTSPYISHTPPSPSLWHGKVHVTHLKSHQYDDTNEWPCTPPSHPKTHTQTPSTRTHPAITLTWSGIQSEVKSVNGVWKSRHMYIKARTFLASTPSKWVDWLCAIHW